MEKLHEKSMQYVVIVDPGIKVERGYKAYERGLDADIFVKDASGHPYLGQVSLLASHHSLKPLEFFSNSLWNILEGMLWQLFSMAFEGHQSNNSRRNCNCSREASKSFFTDRL